MEEISDFFYKYKFITNSIKIGTNQEGSKTGEGAILFESEEECKKAYKER